ncbi:acetyl-CoA carboxylase biotin carboxyl carrier protein [Altererythrobacter indicus]|uniref:Biotin carboxyl carrier protein of acetyl-CoA carboxylase n=1 Tax=Altericroceibacterium indicum TaxID=374177 RepID=A0A845A4N5_9SPHN|nr:acetyl-CoA carboxylase biotin carboxyl carrier protein [Altericroceibacterium indicum]MXP24694.1 acetyl-CoA carboxylase biotin carboxyl carrier protein [Altericroceibacterium indicum]
MADSALPENLRYLIEEFNRSGLRELHIRRGDFELLLSHTDHAPSAPAASRRPASPSPQQAPQAQAPAAPPPAEQIADGLPEGTVAVVAPNLGTFYRSPKPGAAPYVEVGQRVEQGAELCLIEVMKLFTTVRSEVSGTVEAVLVEDTAMVEAGQALFAVRAD